MRRNLIKFAAFDPAKKMSEATATDSTGSPQRIVKGACAVVIGLAQPSPTATAAANELEAKGFRVLAVAAGPPTAMKLAGLIALSDPPRADSAALVTELHGLGVRTVMVTGDAPATAAIVAKAVGLDGAVCPPGPIPDAVHPEQFAVFAGVLPEDKYKLVKAFQKGGHTVGMCGDGANDAPALRQAQIGIAVSTATDVAKSAAGMVLTEPGLAGIVAAVKEGRMMFQRILTYTLNSITKKIVQVLFLVVGLIMTGHAILTPLLMVLDHDHRRLPRHVVDDGQCAAVANAECVADRQLDGRGRRHGNLPSWFFARASWLSANIGWVRHRRAEDAGLCRHRVRQPGDDLYQSRTSASVVVSSKPLARRFVRRRYSDRLDVGHRRNRDDAVAGLDRGRHAGRGGCLRRHLGFGEGSGVSTSWESPRTAPRCRSASLRANPQTTPCPTARESQPGNFEHPETTRYQVHSRDLPALKAPNRA